MSRILTASRVEQIGGLFFNGIDNRVRIPHGPFKFSTYKGVSLVGWVKALPHSYYDPIFFWHTVGFAGSSSTHLRLYLRILPDGVDCTKWIAGFSTDAWHFFAATFDYTSGDIMGYMDGAKVVSDPGRYPGRYCPDAWGLSGLAMYGVAYGRFRGYIDEVRVYSRALTEGEVLKLYEGGDVRDGLVLYFPMDEYEGNTLYDRSGYNNHGTIYGAMWAVKKAARVLKI